MDILQAQGVLERMWTKIESNSKYLQVNKKHVEDYIEHQKAKGADLKTIHKHLYAIGFLLDAIGSKMDLKKATKKDIEKVVAMSEVAKREDGTEYSEEHRVRTRTIIKAFYKHLLGNDLFYPEQVSWIKTVLKMSARVLPEDILTEEEVKSMLSAAQNLRDKALIAILFDSGIRMGELFSLRMKDVDLESNPAHITVKGKTGARQIPIMFSVPYMAQYINLVKDRKPEDSMWKGMGVWVNKDKKLEYAAVRKALQTAARKAGLKKRVYPHLFRHSRASNYANKLTEQQLKAFFGWTGDSHMASTYVHLSGRDIDNAVLQANGMKPLEATAQPKLTVRTCGRCQFANTLDSKYCNRCGTPLDIEQAIKVQEAETKLKEYMIEALRDPTLVEDVIHEYLVQQRQKSKRLTYKR